MTAADAEAIGDSRGVFVLRVDLIEALVCRRGHGDAAPGCVASIDELLDRAMAAINRGDRVAGTAFAEQV